MRIERVWAMPNRNTFDIRPIRKLIDRYNNGGISIDPFANTNRIAKICNDIDPECGTEYCMDALDFLKMMGSGEADLLLFDPPYSVRQVSESYRKVGRTVNMETTQATFWSNLKKEIQRVVKVGGVVISCGWNSGGIGKTLGFQITEILLVPHGGPHNDTIITVERNIQERL
tara:strand:- start:298 stop:813 length:516 start_codon:yes stop_codon:yes gene_type:complete